MKRPTYRDAISWIANEDEPTSKSVAEMEPMISVALVADLFGVDATKVAIDVVNLRRLNDQDDDEQPGQRRCKSEDFHSDG